LACALQRVNINFFNKKNIKSIENNLNYLDPATMPQQATISTMDQARAELGSQHGGGAFIL
jgi:hypothetical protein